MRIPVYHARECYKTQVKHGLFKHELDVTAVAALL